MKTLVVAVWAWLSAKYQGLVYGRTEKCEWCGEPCVPNAHHMCVHCLEQEFGTPEDWQAEWEEDSLRQKIEDVLDPEELEHSNTQDQGEGWGVHTCCKCGGKTHPDGPASVWDPFTDETWCEDCWYKENPPSEQLIKSLPKCEVDFED